MFFSFPLGVLLYRWRAFIPAKLGAWGPWPLLAVLFLLVTAYFFVLGKPHNPKIGRETVSLAKAEQLIQSRANKLRDNVNSPTLPVVLDTLRFEAGWLSESFALSALHWAGIDPGFDVWPIVVDWDEAVLSVAPELRSVMLSTDVAKRIGLLVADVDLGFGVDWMCGRIVPGITVLGGEFQETLGVLIAGLHLESLRWSAFAVHGSIGIGIGPPFLRLYARIKGTAPITQSVSGGWPVTLGELSGSVGMVIRF